jgi:hemoglobin/transferrin/lactoferrin receptor protein
VKPELAMNYEFNSWNKIGSNATIEFGGYYTRIQDYIVNEATSVNGNSSEIVNGVTYSYQRLGNAATAVIMGAYGSYKFTLTKNWELHGTMNFTYGRVQANANAAPVPLDHIPPLSGKFALKYSISKAQAELSMLMNGAKNAEDYSKSGEDNIDKSADPVNGYTPAWHILNVKTSYDISKNFTAQVALENLFDAHYRVFASGLSSAGRNLRLTLRAGF